MCDYSVEGNTQACGERLAHAQTVSSCSWNCILRTPSVQTEHVNQWVDKTLLVQVLTAFLLPLLLLPQVQGVMLAVVVCAGAAVALHAHIDGEERAKRERFLQRQQQREQGRLQRLRMMQGQGQGQGLDGAQLGWQGQPPSARDGTATAGSTSSADQSGQVDTGADKERMSLRQIFRWVQELVKDLCGSGRSSGKIRGWSKIYVDQVDLQVGSGAGEGSMRIR